MKKLREDNLTVILIKKKQQYTSTIKWDQTIPSIAQNLSSKFITTNTQ